MSNLAIIESAVQSGALITMNSKGKVGTFARALAFAHRDERIRMGQLMHAKWLQNGQFRPLVDDILTVGIVPKAALPFIQGLVPVNGPIKREAFIAFCMAVTSYADNLRAKDGTRKEFKGEKSFVLELARRVAEGASEPATIDA